MLRVAAVSDLRTKLDKLVFDARGAVTPTLVSQARSLVTAEGGSPEAVEAFRDSFDSFRSRGYFDAKTRAAVDEAYVALVAALPEGPAVAPGSSAALSARLGQLEGLVSTRKAEITSLEAKLSATEAAIEAKTTQVSSLLTQKQQYQETLRQKEKQRQTLLIFALFGAFGAASSAVGLGSALSINELRGTITKLDQEIAATQQQKSSLESSLVTYRADQRTRRRELSALQASEVGLTSAAADGADVSGLPETQKVLALRGQVDDTQKLADNLRAQVTLLREMNEAASGTNGQLDGLISSLEKDLESLEKRIAASEKALLGVIIDIIFKASGTPPNLNIGGLSISKKALILDGLPGLRMELDKQVDKLVNKMITEGLVNAGTAPDVASAIVKLLRGKPPAAAAKSPTLSALTPEAYAKLSEPQRLVLDSVLREVEPGASREALLGKIAVDANLTDIQARAVAAIALMSEGPAQGQAAAIDAVLAKPALTRRDAARAVIDFALTTTYAPGTGSETNGARHDRVSRLARRTLSFFDADAPAARALADGLSVLDTDAKGPTEDHALVRAHLVAARALATLPDADANRVALEVVRGWRLATAARHGEGADERRLLDAQRAMASLTRLLPAGDAVLATPMPAELPGATARLAAIEAELAARA